MSESPNNLSTLDALVARLLEDELSDGDWAELSELLLDDPVAQDRYLAQATLAGMLQFEYAPPKAAPSMQWAEMKPESTRRDPDDISISVPDSAANSASSRIAFLTPSSLIAPFNSYMARPLQMGLLVATISVTATLLTMAQIRLNDDAQVRIPTPRAFVDSTIVNVAQFTNGADCEWSQDTKSVSPGAFLERGRSLELRNGLAEFTFGRGAVVVVEGPAQFALEGDNLARLERGRMVAKVTTPAAAGFTVKTPTTTIVDTGTEFGVEVDAQGATEVQVFDGKVTLAPGAASFQPADDADAMEREPFTLRAGEAMRVAPGGDPAEPRRQDVAYDDRRFTREIPSRAVRSAASAAEMSKIDGLVLWLRADAIERENPEHVRDFFGNAFVARWPDAADKFQGEADPVQSDEDRQPLLVAGAIGGLPAVRFDRDRKDRLANGHCKILPLGSPRTIFVVGRASQRYDRAVGGTLLTIPATIGDNVPVFSLQQHFSGPNLTPNSHYLYTDGIDAANNLIVDEASDAIVRPFLTVFRSFGEGKAIEVRLNGEAMRPVKPSGIVVTEAARAGFAVGSRGMDVFDQLLGWHGDLAEMLVYDRTLSSEATDKAGRYLAHKYGLRVPSNPGTGTE